MKHIVSKYDKDTIYGIAQQYVSIQRDGEVMRIPFRQIPTVMKVFREEIQARLETIAVMNAETKAIKEITIDIGKNQNRRRKLRVVFAGRHSRHLLQGTNIVVTNAEKWLQLIKREFRKVASKSPRKTR